MTEVWRSGDGCPSGWMRVVKQRVTGASAGTIDLYILSPAGKLLRSKTDLQGYLEKEGIKNVTVDQFNFSKKSVPKDIPTVPCTPGDGGGKRKADSSPAKKKPPSTPSTVVEEKKKRKKNKDVRLHDSPEPVRSKKPTKVRERSPYEFLLEDYLDDEWRFMMVAFFLERHGRQEPPHLRQTLADFFRRFPRAGELHGSGWIAVDTFLKPRGYDEAFARHLTAYTFDYVTNRDEGPGTRVEAHQICGTTDYAFYCYRVFVLRDCATRVKDLDYDTAVYRDWLLNRAKVQALLAKG